MPDPHPSRRKRLQWRLECIGHAMLECLVGRLPGSWAYRIGEWMAGLIWHFMPHRREIIIHNLRIVHGGRRELEDIQQLARESFRRTGGNLVSAARTARLKPAQLGEVIRITNPELVEATIAKGKGVVLLLSHMGNWELLSRLVHLFPEGTRTGAFYRPLNNEILNQRVLERRQADGTRMFSKHDPFHQVCRYLREGGVVGILADQRVGWSGEAVPFFGRLTRSSPLPSLLCRRTKCEVLALSLCGNGAGRWEATFLPVTDPPSTPHCMMALEQAMAASLPDVFWLQNRWRTYPLPGEGFRKWLKPHDTRSSNPHRALLWLGGDAAEWPSETAWPLDDEWTHPDVDYELVLKAGQPPPSTLPAISRQHPAPAASDEASLLAFLRRIDRSLKLPIDTVVAVNAPPALRKACKQLAIDFVALG